MKLLSTIAICLGMSAQASAGVTFCYLSAQKDSGEYTNQVAQGYLGQELGAQLILRQTDEVIYMAYRDSQNPGQYGLAVMNIKDLTSVASIYEGGTRGILFDSHRKMFLSCADSK